MKKSFEFNHPNPVRMATLGLLLLPALNAFPANPPAKPNFVFILCDDLGWSSTSLRMDKNLPNSGSDYFETPNMERLAAKGVHFSNGYAPCALCCPTRRSIQFGQSPARQGDLLFPENYQPDLHTMTSIPLMLKSISKEYRAAHYGKWDLRADIFPEDIGYDESDGDTGNNHGDMNSSKETKWTDLFLNNDPKRMESITARGLNFMSRQVKSGHPFYLQLSHYATHVDMQTREETYQKYLQKKKGAVHNHPGFAGMLENLDGAIGRVLDKIEELGIADHTYIILMTDNGGVEAFPPVKNKFDHPSQLKVPSNNFPLRGGKWTLYEGGIRVPFMVAGPGIPAGMQCDIPVTGWDLLPTLSDLAGNRQPLPDNLDGTSIRPLLERGNKAQFSRKSDELIFHYYGKSHSAIRAGDWKLIKFWNLKKLELYHLKDDPGELKELSAANPEITRELETKLMNYLEKVHAEILYPPKNVKTKVKNRNSDD